VCDSCCIHVMSLLNVYSGCVIEIIYEFVFSLILYFIALSCNCSQACNVCFVHVFVCMCECMYTHIMYW